MSDGYSMEIDGLVLTHGPLLYSVSCEVEFDLLNPKDDIYRPDGEPSFDKGQDEVNFRQVWIKSVLKRRMSGDWHGVLESEFELINELVLDWCRDTPEMHIQAFKAAKRHK